MTPSSRRNFIILAVFLGAVIYGTVFIVDNAEPPRRKSGARDDAGTYLRSLRLRLRELLEGRHYTEAEIIVRRILKQVPENRAAQLAAGKIYYHNGKLNEAENILRGLLLRYPDDALCRNNYAMVLLARERREALNELRKAFAASSGSGFILENYRYASGKLKEAGPEPELGNEAGPPLYPVPPLDAITAPEEAEK